jgi:transcription factor TFIIIB component B''
LNAEKVDLSMKLRNRKKEAKVSEHITDDNFDEEYAEPSAAERDNDSGDEYTAGEKQKPQRKSRGSKRTSKNSTTEKPAQKNQQKDKSEVPSRGRKRALKDDALTEQPEKKKLTHRIRQKRTKGIWLK